MLLWAFPVTTFGLGTWQVYRYYWKKNLIKKAEESLRKDPVDGLTTEEYRKMKLNGIMHEELIPVNGIEGGIRGNYIIQPFTLKDGTRILVQRGFIRDNGNLTTSSDEGIVLRNEKQGFRPDNTPKNWYWKDVDNIARLFQTQPVLVGMVKTPEHRAGIVPKPSYHNNHMQYIITWFSISAITSLMLWNRRKPILYKRSF
eukprot:NODE_36_length_36011_cov_1.012920.p18 type:complete len:200 gc:universal NODE_36_length_36011_cov_1.012920:27721-28320(+)